MSFVIRRKLDLSDLAEGWEGAYIVYSPIPNKENDRLLNIQEYREKILNNDMEAIKTANDKTMQIVVDHFIEGMGFDGEKLVPITKKNLTDLPDEVLTELFQLITGKIDIKKNKPSQK